MWWRLKRSDFERQKGSANKLSMRSLVASGEIPGILAYVEGGPIGWCAIAPRESYSVLERSRVLKRIDDEPVWSVTCLFVKKERRNQNVSVELLRAAIEYVKERHGMIVEGYPVEPRTARMPDAFAWTGLVSAFKQAGFVECARASQTRPIMRFRIKKQKAIRRRKLPANKALQPTR
jgi:GNAT superfamily N-acetyltransferase